MKPSPVKISRTPNAVDLFSLNSIAHIERVAVPRNAAPTPQTARSKRHTEMKGAPPGKSIVQPKQTVPTPSKNRPSRIQFFLPTLLMIVPTTGETRKLASAKMENINPTVSREVSFSD